MAGGIFPNYPFQINIKCVIFSIIIIGLFFYRPPEMELHKKYYISLVLFIVSYVSMAWYDYKFDCQVLALKRGTSPLSITGQLKPPLHTPSQTDMTMSTPKEINLESTLINIYHIFVVTPLLLYIGYNKEKTTTDLNILLAANLSFAILYHGSRLSKAFSPISAGHLIIGILGIYYINNKTKPSWYYSTLTGIGVYTGIKHGLFLMQKVH